MTLWDTGNLERAGIRNVTRSYFRHAVGVALVYDIGNRETLDALCDWVFRIKDSISWQWEKSLCMAVWGNDRDHNLTKVSGEQMKAFLSYFGLGEEHCYEVDAYSGCNVFESYQSLIERIHVQLGSSPAQQHVSMPQPSQNTEACSC